MTVFICYRRDQSVREAELIYSRLESRIGANRVFMDVGTLRLGSEFQGATVQALSDANLVLLLIGPDWEAEISRRSRDRLPDLVREEIMAARANGTPIIPLLLGRDGARLDPTLLDQGLSFLNEVNHEELRSSRLMGDFDDLVRRMSFDFPQIFGGSLAPVILEEDFTRALLGIPLFSAAAVRPALSTDTWASAGTFTFAGSPSDDFYFEVYEPKGQQGVCFINGYDDVTNVSVCTKNGVSRGEVRLSGKRSQYGFYWPQYYFSVFGSFGARDYFYSENSGSPLRLLSHLIYNWVFMIDGNEESLERGDIVDCPLGSARRSLGVEDVLVFPTQEPGPVRYYRSYSGLHADDTSQNGARGTVVQWSQRGGGYREFSFVLKDALNRRKKYWQGRAYLGTVDKGGVSVEAVEVAEDEELFVHPSGIPIIVRRSDSGGLLFEFGAKDEPRAIVESIEFENLGSSNWPRLSFSRDGRTVAVSLPSESRTVLADLFTCSILAIIPEHIDAEFSPDGERLSATRVGRQRSISIFSKRGEQQADLGPVDYRKSIQFGYMDNDHFEVHEPVKWCDTGRRVFILHDKVVTMHELQD